MSQEAYKVWECQVCGFVYDEAQGWPDIIFRYRFAKDARPIVNLVTQGALPNPQQTNSKRD